MQKCDKFLAVMTEWMNLGISTTYFNIHRTRNRNVSFINVASDRTFFGIISKIANTKNISTLHENKLDMSTIVIYSKNNNNPGNIS